MSLLTQPFALSSATNPVAPRTDERRSSDVALAAYSRLAPDQWHGRHSFQGGEIIFPDPQRAREIRAAAVRSANTSGDLVRAMKLADEALRLDYIGALNEGANLISRLEIYWTAGRDEPYRSIELYDIGTLLSRSQHWREAGAIYLAAADLDPLFAWHANNLAWMAATATDPRAHAGHFAVELAEGACTVSGWGCWCFLGTLAAAYARAGDFARAVAWQRVTLHLAHRDERGDALAVLREFESGQAYVDHERKPAAGDNWSNEDLAQLDVSELLRKARTLIQGRNTSVH